MGWREERVGVERRKRDREERINKRERHVVRCGDKI